MEKEKQKKRNRLISIAYISVFLSSLVLFGCVVTNIALTFIENQKLQSLKESMQDDLSIIGGVQQDAEEGYFIVYAANDYVIEQSDGEVIVIYEMK